jgi:shikimate dehydrogenase
MDRAYLAFHVTPSDLRIAVRAIPAFGLLGVNLTVPHKERALRLMAHLSDEARTLGAVNCVVNRNGVLYGDNTDARGLEADLRHAGLRLDDQLAVIIGAGGAAASAILACQRLGAARIVIFNRTEARAKRLALRFAGHASKRRGVGTSQRIEVYGLEMLSLAGLIASAALIINATPIGLAGHEFPQFDYGATPPQCLFYDLIYAREPTPFLRPALASGKRALDGAGMLLKQGELAFELFNGLHPPPGSMSHALMAALGHDH